MASINSLGNHSIRFLLSVLLLLLLLLSFFILICIFIVYFLSISSNLARMHIFLFVKNSASFNFFIAHSYFSFILVVLFWATLKKNEGEEEEGSKNENSTRRDRSKIPWVFIASKMNSSLRPGKKKIFPRRSISHFCCRFSRSKGSKNISVRSQFFTLDLPQTHTHTHTHTHEQTQILFLLLSHSHPPPTQHSLAPHWMITPHIPATSSTFDFIPFSFCVYFTLDKNCALHFVAARNDYVILFGPQPISLLSVVHFLRASLDFPRTKRRMQFGARKLATIHACTKLKNKRNTTISMLWLLLLLLLLFDLRFHA